MYSGIQQQFAAAGRADLSRTKRKPLTIPQIAEKPHTKQTACVQFDFAEAEKKLVHCLLTRYVLLPVSAFLPVFGEITFTYYNKASLKGKEIRDRNVRNRLIMDEMKQNK